MALERSTTESLVAATLANAAFGRASEITNILRFATKEKCDVRDLRNQNDVHMLLSTMSAHAAAMPLPNSVQMTAVLEEDNP